MLACSTDCLEQSTRQKAWLSRSVWDPAARTYCGKKEGTCEHVLWGLWNKSSGSHADVFFFFFSREEGELFLSH